MLRAARSGLCTGQRTHARVFAALGDPTRRSLVARLCNGQACPISQLTEQTKLTRQAVTKQLRVLERARIVYCTRAGRERRFAFDPAPLRDLRTYLDLVSEQWDQALSRLQDFVEG